MVPGLWSSLLVMAAVCLITVDGYPNGKVTAACKSMVPRHGHEPSPLASPYRLIVDKTTFSPGDTIQVTLTTSTPGATPFKGFLIEARDAAHLDGDAVGSFTLLNSSLSRLLHCGTTQDSAVSQSSATKKTEVHVNWKGPNDAPPSIQFLATVVEHYSVYWVKILSPLVSQSGVSPPVLSSTAHGETTAASILPGPFSSDGCGTTKSCLRDPEGCDPQSNPQCFYLSFTPEGQSMFFQLSGPAAGYVAFALSLDKWMGNDDVYLCVRDEDQVDISAAYSSGRSFPEVASKDVLMDRAWRLSDGVIQCSFRRRVHLPEDQSRFSLDHSYYLFMADGRAEFGALRRHDRQPLISSKRHHINGRPMNLSGSRSPLMIKFHGAFMFIAWMTTVTTGVIIARFFKSEWPGRTLFGQQVWFQVHRGLMMLTVLITCIAVILPFIYRGSWSYRAGTHASLGCVVIALVALQLFSAVLRPDVNAPRRYIFNWLHFSGGTIAQIIAVAAIFIGVQQQALLLPGPLSVGLLSGVIIWSAATGLLLELHGRLLRQKSSEDERAILPDPSNRLQQGSVFKQVVFVVFLTGNIGFLITFLYLISNV